MVRPASPPIAYRVEIADLHAHLFRVTLTIERPDAGQTLSLPVWIPGSYLVREFSGQLQQLSARQGRQPLTVHQLDKCSWQLACRGAQSVQVQYEVYANDPSVRTALLGHDRGFFNATSLCLRVHGQEDKAHGLQILAPKGKTDWIVATGLRAGDVDRRGFGHYLATDYDELADCPVTLGRLWSGQFKACGVPHQLVVSGAPAAFDGERLLKDAQTLCETQITFWHGSGKPPFRRYVFMLHAMADGYGGLEHRNSTALLCGRKDLPVSGQAKAPEGYTTLLGLISHEYFHAWNVKRLRPAEFARYDYSRENYTRLLWFFEGFTSYYDDLLLRRAGLIDNATYLKLLGKTINQVLQTPGRAVQSVAQASMDAWVKYYRPHENTPNATVSYYSKGALVALCLDLTLRRGTPASSLDALMRALWAHCKGGPMSQDDLLMQLQALGKRSYQPEIDHWVHSTQELPVKELLQVHGVSVLEEPDALGQRLGLRVDESQGIRIKTVLTGGAARAAGMVAGDEWLGIETPSGQAWRLRKLDDLLLYCRPGEKMQALVCRDEQLLRLPLRLPEPGCTWRLTVGDAQRLDSWLAPTSS